MPSKVSVGIGFQYFNDWCIHLIPKWPLPGKNWGELHENEVIRAKTKMFYSSETFRTKVSGDKIWQMRCVAHIC